MPVIIGAFLRRVMQRLKTAVKAALLVARRTAVNALLAAANIPGAWPNRRYRSRPPRRREPLRCTPLTHSPRAGARSSPPAHATSGAPVRRCDHPRPLTSRRTSP